MVLDLVSGQVADPPPCGWGGGGAEEAIATAGTLPDTTGAPGGHSDGFSMLTFVLCGGSRPWLVRGVFLFLDETCDETEDKLMKEKLRHNVPFYF